MKPLIFEYLEKSKFQDLDFSTIIYDEKLNLSVNRKTGLPAISSLNLSTQTFTRTFNEESDSDNDRMKMLMGTATQTLYQLEGSDDDNGFGRNQNT